MNSPAAYFVVLLLLSQTSNSLPWVMPGDFLQRLRISDLVASGTIQSSSPERNQTVDRINFEANIGHVRVDRLFQATLTKAAAHSAGEQLMTKTHATCPVTLPRRAPKTAQPLFGGEAAHWNGALFVGGLWPDGTITFQPGGPGFILPDGSLSMKFGWLRGPGLRGKLTIHGKRLDASAPPLRAEIPEGYGDTGFQATALIFTTEGCWEVTGAVGATNLTFVTRVVKLGKHK